MPRLFIALPIEPKIKTSLIPIYEFLSTHDQSLKTITPGNYHITMKFIGECGKDLALKIENTFSKIKCPEKEIPFSFTGLGVFPNIKMPNVIWAGLKTDEKATHHLFQLVEGFTSAFGFEKEKRKFTPHLALARVRKDKKISDELREYIIANKNTYFAESSFKKLALYSSNLTPEGPVFTELKSIHFKIQ